ncbi:MAG: hypothetical protein QOF31_605 [Mycobacterium sp.]|jgi:hypothetical protein|nr:hypothetical protein [Mycobacterium sp.]
MACLHGWPPNAGTGNPTRLIPVNPHIGTREQDLPGDHHRSGNQQGGADDVAEKARVGGVHGFTISVFAVCVFDAGRHM